MKAVLSALYSEPIVFLGVLAATATGLAGTDVFAPWIGVVIVSVITSLQRAFVSPTQNP